MSETAANSKNIVQSFAKGFRVLECFTAQEPELTLSEISVRAGLDRGTVFRLLNTLVMLGYVVRLDGTRRFCLTLKTLDLGFNAIARADLRAVARPALRALVGVLCEAASIGVLDGPDVVYIERVQAGLTRLGVDIRIGTRIPAYCTAIGHSILAHLDPEERLRALDARQRIKLTPATPVDIDVIMARLDRVRALGYAVSDQEVTSGLRVLASAIVDEDGRPVAAVSAAAPVFQMSLEDFVSGAGERLSQAARDIGRALRAAGASAVQINV
jgi:IclR family transcriptional regulator, pca regulon regulatory protein